MEYKKIISYLQQNNLKEAKKEVFKDLSVNPNDSNLYNFLGTIQEKEGDITSALKNFRNSVKLNAENYNANHNLALFLSRLNLENPEIDFFFKKSIECKDQKINPNYVNFLINYGLFLNKIKSTEGEKYFRLALASDSKNFRAYVGLSQYYFDHYQFDECIKICKEAIHDKMISHEGLYYDLGNSYLQKKKLQESKEAFLKALNFNKFNSETHSNLGMVFYFAKNYEQSLFHFNMAIKLNPKSWKSLSNIGNVYLAKKDFVNALKNYKKSYFLNKSNPLNLDRLAKYYSKFNKRKLAINFYKKAVEIEKELLSNYLYYLVFDEDVNYHHYLNEAKKINFKKKSSIKITNEGYKKNKIGFVSADFRNHSVGYFIKDTLKEMSKTFEIYCFSNSVQNDDLTDEIKKNVYSWNEIDSVNTEEVRSEIIKKKIDILFDLGGHTADNRLDLFATRSSPIQITWCGWLASSGLYDMDYTVIDKNIFTKNLNKYFIEKFIIMDSVWNAYSPHLSFFDKSNETPPCIKNGYLTFGAFHNLLKINDQVIDTWVNILKGTKNKIYFMSNDFTNDLFLQKFTRRFISKGLTIDQLIFSKGMVREIYLNEYKKIDLYLDTFPYTGVTSSFDSAGMNVPILTLKGDYFLSRCGYSINANLDLHELVANTISDYVNIGKNFTFKDIIKYKKLLSSINKKKCALFNSENFSKELVHKLKQLM